MRALLPGLLVAGLVVAASAQVIGPEVGVTGVVVPTPGPIGCGPATHMLMCTQVFLAGDVGLLESLVGKNVKLFGHEELLPGAPCTLVKVESVADPPPARTRWKVTLSGVMPAPSAALAALGIWLHDQISSVPSVL